MTSTPATYRFAFYGRSGSGKTCLLSALAMSRRPHPDGYTATRVPLEDDGAGPDDEPTPRQRGDAWIEEAVGALQRGELPRANQASDFLMTFHYEFTSPDRRTYRVELVDYSGELINPRDLADSQSLAARLREQLLEMDGLLVLAEAPRQDEVEHLSTELNLLRQAFVSLRGEKQDGPALDAPVALLVSKWDRQSDLAEAPAPDGELQRLDEFFESTRHGEYRQLRNDLRNGVTDGNFRTFPVSALGPVEAETRDDGRVVERPARAPLPSFGLEDGFVWAARRCDAAALRDCERRSLGESWMWPPWRAATGRLAAGAARLARRFPRGDDQRQRALRISRLCRAKQLARGLLTAAAVLIVAAASEGLLDHAAYRQVEAALADPTTPAEEVARHEGWLEAYSGSGSHRHRLYKLLLPADSAFEKVQSLRRQRVEADWRRVEQVEDLLARAAAAADHLQAYPNTSHLEEVRGAVAQADQLRQSRENESWWTLLSTDSRRALEERDQQQLSELLQRIDSPPHAGQETEQQHGRRTELRLEIATLLGELAAEKQWAEFLDEYSSHVDAGRHLDAGALLARRIQQRSLDERLESACSEFRKHLANGLPEELKELVRRNKWTDARQLVLRLERSLPQWPEQLHPAASTAFVAHQRQVVDTAYDRHLYDVLRRTRTSGAAQDYLDVSPLGAMRQDVEKFKRWLDSRNEALELTLVLTRIDWGSGAQWANDNHVVVRLNEETISEKTKVASKQNTSTGELMRHRFRGKLDDDIKLSVAVEERDPFSSDDHGRGEQTVRVYDLGRGVTLPLRTSKYYQEAVFHLEGLPAEPQLPEWRND